MDTNVICCETASRAPLPMSTQETSSWEGGQVSQSAETRFQAGRSWVQAGMWFALTMLASGIVSYSTAAAQDAAWQEDPPKPRARTVAQDYPDDGSPNRGREPSHGITRMTSSPNRGREPSHGIMRMTSSPNRRCEPSRGIMRTTSSPNRDREPPRGTIRPTNSRSAKFRRRLRSRRRRKSAVIR